MTKRRVTRVLVFCISLFIVILIPVNALGDEAWTSEIGEIEWEKNVGDTAVFKFLTPGVEKSATRMFINYLVPDTTGEGRGTYSGYWVDDSKRKTCEAVLTDPLGSSTRSWGILEISFASADGGYFEWTARLGDCFERPDRKLVAKPIRGSGAESKPESDPLVRLAKELSKAYAMRALDNLDDDRTGDGKIEIIIEHSLAEDSTEKFEVYDFAGAERWLKRNEIMPGTPARQTEKLLVCKDGTCRYDVRGLLHNQLYLKSFTYGMSEGKPFIKAIYLLDGD